MLGILLCVRDQHDPRLVVLAALVCILASLTAVCLLRKAQASERPAYGRWLVVAGTATGLGIWATHFIAMLGYDPGVVAGYHAGLTLASLLIAVALTTTGFTIAVNDGGRGNAVIGGAVVGAGAAAMHYMGMSAVEVPGHFLWSPMHVAASVLASVLLAIPATVLATRRDSTPSGVAAGLLLVAAIVLLHFTGMTGLSLVPSASDPVTDMLLSPMALGVSIFGAALLMLALCLGVAILDGRTQARISNSEREFRLFIQGITDCAICMLDKDGRVASWNVGAEQLKGYAADEVIGRPIDTFYTPEDQACGVPRQALETASRDGKFVGTGWRVRKDGSQFWAHVTVERVHGDRGEFRGFAKITRDMTRVKEDQDRLASLSTNLDVALSNMYQGLCLFDADERLVVSNSRVGELFGLTTQDCPPGTTFRETLRLGMTYRMGAATATANLPDAYQRHRNVIESGGGTMTVEFSPDFIMSIVHRPIAGGGWVTTLEDITERRRSENRIHHMALHDPLTGLPNRAHYNRRLEAELQTVQRQGGRLAILAIDLDRFKEVNDLRGHAVGDEVLRRLSARFVDCLQDRELVARFGGDEFAAFKPYDEDAELNEFIARIEACLTEPLSFDDYELQPAGSLGIAIFPQDGTTCEQILNNADLAMYRAKATIGQTTCFYEPRMDEIARERRRMGKDLKDALRSDELSIAYQVQCAVSGGAVTGYEALLRWHHPRRGWVSPVAFIPVAEENGLILELGEWVLRRACAEAASWPEPHKVAVNLSPLQLAQADLPALVRQVLIDTGLSPRRLELEITESAIIGDKARALHSLRQLKGMGLTIAIDDFGTGYSSLDTLNSFPFDKIKIDRSFLMEAETSAQARAIIRAVLALGRSLEVPVLAEGVETQAQLDLLAAEGCDQVQGYLLGRPGPMPVTATVEPSLSRAA